ncbi:MAG: class I SAM-dependent methyltransferase [Blastocatellia bacterium]|jgi:predicted O-methyltransferase YrrM|nr:class I SAM-dependent methyltransferase [Blastocatellia bacterium]
MNEDWIKYAEDFTSDESEVLLELRQICNEHYEDKSMLSGFFQGRVLSMLSKMLRPKVVLEIGTYLGYSALCFAEGLAAGGKVITLDVNEDTNKVARSFIEKSQYAGRIEFHLGNAVEIIPKLSETFDLVFIDADKPNYTNYYNLVFDKVRPDGFIIADNVLWSGQVLLEEKDDNTLALHEFNKMIKSDARVSNVLLPIRDGLMVARKEKS